MQKLPELPPIYLPSYLLLTINPSSMKTYGAVEQLFEDGPLQVGALDLQVVPRGPYRN